jgi:hypothetical protein
MNYTDELYGNLTIEAPFQDKDGKTINATIKIPNARIKVIDFYPKDESKILIKKWEKMEIFIPEEDAK